MAAAPFNSSSLTIFALLSLILTSIPASHAFLETEPLLAWSTAPGVLLEESLIGFTQEGVSRPQTQLALGSHFASLCPSGSSSLLVFTLSSRAQQQSLQKGFLSPEISKQYNSAPESARLWINNRPFSSGDQTLNGLAATWKSRCKGRVVIQELSANDDITSVFLHNINELAGPLLVIFTTTPLETWKSLHKRQLSSNLLANEFVPRGMPSSKSGVFWRYSFLSDYLIIGVLVMFLLFVPPVLLGCYALSSIESPKGLKTKMVGQISEVKGN